MLAVALISMIFYFHPSTSSATLYYRTVPIVPEATGRVAEVMVFPAVTGVAVSAAIQAATLGPVQRPPARGCRASAGARA